MPEGTPPLLIAIIVLVLLSGFFSATETSYTSLNVIKVKSLVQKEAKYKKVLALYDKYDKLLSTILIGNNIVNITATSLSMLFFEKIITGSIDYSVVSTVVTTVVVLIFGEIIPKYLAKAYPEKIAVAFYPLIILFYYILIPFNFVFGLIKKLIDVIFRLKTDDAITDEELITIVNEAEEDGTLREEESNLIRSAIEFDDLEVRDILRPRINMVCAPVDALVSDIKSIFEKERYSRIPLYSENVDSIVGIIHEKDFYRNYRKKDFNIKDIMQEVVFVVEHTKISVLLKKLQSKKLHMAIVLDEYGGTLGLVTVEDIIEELVGEIYDEHDEEIVEMKENQDGTFTISGAMEIDNFFEKFDLLDDEEQFDANSVGGWVTEFLGEIPLSGKTFEYKNLVVKVTKSTRKKVLEINVSVKVEEETE
ncbi:MAG: HlyC/CorC family transporter [Clostridia bacterium]|nr:HlyC/CorC family transporter [Clostridia bacterium]